MLPHGAPRWLRFLALAVLGTVALRAQDATLVLDGKPLITPQPPTRVGGELFVPLAPIAQALGAGISVGTDQTVRVRRADGGMVTFDGRTGEIRSGAVLVGQVANYRLIRISSEVEQLLFPLTAVVTLLGVNVRTDDGARVVYLDSLPGGGAPLPTGSGGLKMTDLGYNYNMTTNGQIFGQNANLRGQALAGAATLTGLVQLTRVPNGPFLYLNQASLRADLSPTRAFIFGDQAVYSGVEALTNSLRGLGFEQKLKGFTAYVYGGKAVGTTAASFGSSIPRYDTELVGASLRAASLVQTFSVGLNAFRNAQRQGTSVGIGFSRRFAIDQFNLQAVGGVFSGLSLHVAPLDQVKADAAVAAAKQDNPAGALLGTAAPTPSFDVSHFIEVHGPAYGFSASNAFLPVKQLTISGQVDYYSANFLTAREDTRFNGAMAGALSVSVRPFRLLTLNASAGDRQYLLGEVRKTRTYTMGGTLLMPGKNMPQLGYMRTLQLDASSDLGRFELEQYSIMLPSLGRLSASVFYTETRMGTTRAQDVNGLAGIDLHRAGRFDLHYQSQFHSNRRYGGDWYYKFGEHDGFLRLGVDMMRTYGGQAGLLPLVGLRLPLPHKQVLEITYLRDVSTQILQVQLGGKLITPHEILRDSRGNPRINVRTSISGTVYTDLNYNGTFDGADRGIADVQVWLDDRTMITSDARGSFRFENLEPGAHVLRAELGAVPAGFVFATPGSQTVAAVPSRENRAEFRVIRTGQITGKVTYMDYSDDADHPKEKPLADARILVTGDGDTYSEANGVFLIGDLAPGRYELHLDPTSLPRGYVPQPSSVTVTVTPGGVSRDTVFKLAIPPKPVIEIQAPDQKIEMPVDSKPGEKLKDDRRRGIQQENKIKG